MKTIMSTLIAVGVLAGTAHAHDAFSDPRQALPRTSNDDHRDAVPFTEDVFPDIVIAKP
jgi:hypothetical protein